MLAFPTDHEIVTTCNRLHNVRTPGIISSMYILAALLIDHLDRNDPNKEASILVFLPGYGEIQELHEQLSSLSSKLWVLALHSTISAYAIEDKSNQL